MATPCRTNPEAEKFPPSRVTWWQATFSFPAVCMVLMIGLLLSFCVQHIAEPDLWWHLRNAHTLLHYHSLSKVDTYSFTAAGTHWISFEWLSEVAYYLAFSAMGLQGVLLLYFTILVLIFIAVYYRSSPAGADCKDAAVTTLGAICLGGVSIAPRTLLFGWLCLTGLLLVLDHFRRSGEGIWLLPPLFALWINFHGSWPFGMLVLVVTIVAGMVDGQWGPVTARRWNRQQLRHLVLALAASIAALFVNPFGYRLVFYPVNLLFHQQGVMNFIDEWSPVEFGTVNGTLALGLIFGLMAAALFSELPWELEDVLLSSFALWAALSHVRFLFFAGIIIMPVLAPRLKLFPPYEPEREKILLNAVIIAGLLGAMIWYFPSQSKLRHIFDQEYPKAALAFMERNHIQGRIFNQYKFGGYIEFNAPEYKTFIDGRADLFIHEGAFYDYLRASALQHTFEILDKYQVQYIFVQPTEPMVYMLQHSTGWKTIYSDNVAVLIERTTASDRANAN